MRIGVIDGQGGGIGKAIVEKLRKELADNVEIYAFGTNSAATVNMKRAGADEAATGENAIVYNSDKVDIIVGVIGIIVANSMMGELTPSIARAVSESRALKILIPLNRCNLEIVGVQNDPLPIQIDKAVEKVKKTIENRAL